MVLYINIFSSHLFTAVKNIISIRRKQCFLTILFAMPTAVALSQWMVVGGWRCPISDKVSRNTLPSLIFKNIAPNYALAADEAMNLRTVHNLLIALFRRMGGLFCGIHPKK